MRRIFALGALLLSTQIFAEADILKTFDGGVAYCQNQEDVIRYAPTGVVSLKVEKIADLGESLSLKIRVNFLNCEKTENGFEFVPMSNPLSYSYEMPDRQVHVERKNMTLRAFNTDYTVLDAKPIDMASRFIGATLLVNKAERSEQRDGRSYVDLDLTSMVRLSDTLGNTTEFEPVVFSTFRLFF